MRKVIEQIQARKTSDGDGVNLLRVFGGQRPERFDPFLMLDEFGSESASDYIGGFPPHPHRGFETVTYMLQGKMEHKDHMGNVGLLEDSDVQWMTAGSGIIHSEMPKQTEGKMRGFQLWVNLPAKNKMKPAHYQDVSGGKIPEFEFSFGKLKALAGSTEIEGKNISGFFNIPDTEVIYLDVHVEAQQKTTIKIDNNLNSLVYVYDGEARIGLEETVTKAQSISRMDMHGDLLIRNSGEDTLHFLVLAGKPLKEAIVQYGPFVMNTAEEINQAVKDYQNGTLTQVQA